jgi:hypothetical protein
MTDNGDSQILASLEVKPMTERWGDGVSTVMIDRNSDSDVLLISFAVFPGPDGKSAFDFVGVTSDLPATKVFFRDPNMLWYQLGLDGVGKTVPEIAAYVRNLRATEQSERVVMIGNSGGGFAAILFGTLTGADEIHAFNPPTKLLVEADTSYPEQLAILHSRTGLDNPYIDLRKILLMNPSANPSIYIHYSRGDKKDRKQARYLKNIPNVHLLQYPFISHHLARYLAKRGALSKLMLAAIANDTPGMLAIVTRNKFAALPLYPPLKVSWFVTKVWGRLTHWRRNGT